MPAKRSWYARTTWTCEDREDFMARLREVGAGNEQASCLRKQAAHLLQHADKLRRAGDASGAADQVLAGARELYEAFLDWHGDSADKAYVFCALGDIEAGTGTIDAALERYRQALQAQQSSSRSTSAHLRFGVVVIEHQRSECYTEALRHLETHAQPLIYPLEQYQHCGIRAHLLSHAGDRALAVLCARDAIDATKHIAVASETRFHQGLVNLLATGRLTSPTDFTSPHIPPETHRP